MKKIFNLIVSLILVFNSVIVYAEDETILQAIANANEEFGEYIDIAIEKSGLEREKIDISHISVIEYTSLYSISNNYGTLQICVILPLKGKDDFLYATFKNKDCTDVVIRDVLKGEPLFETAYTAYSENNNLEKYLKDNNISNPQKIHTVCLSGNPGFNAYYIECDNEIYIIPFYEYDVYEKVYEVIDAKEYEIHIGKAYTQAEAINNYEATQKIYHEYVQEKENSQSYYYRDEDGDAVLHTPVPKPTEKPTTKPTEKPTVKPTEKPTATPTEKPTAVPTEKPTEPPTEKPSERPSEVPTAEPEKSVITVISDKDKITVKADKEEILFTDAYPYIDENGRTQIPIRAVGESLKCDVNWNEADRTVTLTRNGTEVIITIDSNEIKINGKATIMDTKAKIIGERTYIPLRFAAEALGMTVNWKTE